MKDPTIAVTLLRILLMLYLLVLTIGSIYFAVFVDGQLQPYFTTDLPDSSDQSKAHLAQGYLCASAILSGACLLSVAINSCCFYLRGSSARNERPEKAYASLPRLISSLFTVGVCITMTVLAILTAVHAWTWSKHLGAEGDRQQHLSGNCRGLFGMIIAQLVVASCYLVGEAVVSFVGSMTQYKYTRNMDKRTEKETEARVKNLETQYTASTENGTRGT